MHWTFVASAPKTAFLGATLMLMSLVDIHSCALYNREIDVMEYHSNIDRIKRAYIPDRMENNDEEYFANLDEPETPTSVPLYYDIGSFENQVQSNLSLEYYDVMDNNESIYYSYETAFGLLGVNSSDIMIFKNNESSLMWRWLNGKWRKKRYDILDLVVTVVATAAVVLSIICIASFLQHIIRAKRQYSLRESETCIYGYGVNSPSSPPHHRHGGGCSCSIGCDSGITTPSIPSMETGSVLGTMEMGTQYDDNDVMIPSFVNEDLIVELNDRDSTCTSVSEGFTYSKDYSNHRINVGVTEL